MEDELIRKSEILRLIDELLNSAFTIDAETLICLKLEIENM